MASHYKIQITGIVQGVGFRPFVYRLACRHEIIGEVCNNSVGVLIACACSPKDLDVFVANLQDQAPPTSSILSLTVQPVQKNVIWNGFSIVESKKQASSSALVSADLALCPDCLFELFQPGNRRYLHPFINCTNCGSRYSIISQTPYDRSATSMQSFELCTDCQREYSNPEDRRFHAEPVCCNQCGPTCTVTMLYEPTVQLDLHACGPLLEKGMVGALKGVGGFQLCCDALSDSAIQRIRDLKHRSYKPFAIMAESLAAIKELCDVSVAEEVTLTSSACPIVLLRLKKPEGISRLIHRGLSHVGVMLPVSGLHQLVFHYSGLSFLLMTSANVQGEPLSTKATQLLHDFPEGLDFYVDHNRSILNRIDDSVVTVVGGETRLIRRARGYAPVPLTVPIKVDGVVALGGQQKNSFALGRGQESFISPHIGNLQYLATCEFQAEVLATYKSLLQLDYKYVVHDLHPAYETTKIAASLGLVALGVQHHHAHHASCMAEHGLSEPCLGIILDGTGFGDDGTVWGGEVLLADFSGFERLYHFEPVPLLGCDQAAEYPPRMAFSYLSLFCTKDELRSHFNDMPEFNLFYSMLHSAHTMTSSSCGRLFDAVAFVLLDLQENSFEGQGGMLVECLAEESGCEACHEDVLGMDIQTVLPTARLFHAVWRDVKEGQSNADVARKFMNTLTLLLVKTVEQARQKTGIKKVVLSGGVFQNRILLADCERRLRGAGFDCFSQQRVPSNDGGLALGQLCIGAAHFKRES